MSDILIEHILKWRVKLAYIRWLVEDFDALVYEACRLELICTDK